MGCAHGPSNDTHLQTHSSESSTRPLVMLMLPLINYIWHQHRLSRPLLIGHCAGSHQSRNQPCASVSVLSLGYEQLVELTTPVDTHAYFTLVKDRFPSDVDRRHGTEASMMQIWNSTIHYHYPWLLHPSGPTSPP
jgi:hypothetical protein